MTLTMSAAVADEIVAHVRAGFPNEACGLLAGRDGVVERHLPMANAERSPVLFRLDPADQLRAFREIDDAGLELVAIYHSHTRSPAYPSDTDVSLAYYPEAVYLIVSLAEDEPVLRGFRIVEERITEVDLMVG